MSEDVDKRAPAGGSREDSRPHPLVIGAFALLGLVVIAGIAYNVPRSGSGCASSQSFSVADLPQYLASCDKAVSLLIDSASVSGNTLSITVNSGWYAFSSEQKASLVAELLPAVFILARAADEVPNPGNAVVAIFDSEGRLVGLYSGDTGRYLVYR